MFRSTSYAIACVVMTSAAWPQLPPTPPGTDFCQPGTGGVIACPCANPPGGSPEGCDNSRGFGGAVLASAGVATPGPGDTLTFTTSWVRLNTTGILLQSTVNSSPPGFVFAQGVRCLGVPMKRLYTRSTNIGTLVFGHLIGTDPDVHVRSAALGDVIITGTHRYYQVYYRDPTVLGGCPSTSTFNISQGQDVLW